MRRRAFALLVACAWGATACGHSGATRLEGHWKGVRAEGVSSELQATANSFAAATELDVKGDSITVSFPNEKQSGHYRIVREDKASVVLTTEKDGPDAPQTFTFVDARTMKWSVLEGRSIVFVKQ
jgi:hypothetical protein